MKDDFGFEVEFVTEKQMQKSIKSCSWENICLDKKGDFTVFLHKNYTSEYQQWNRFVEELKANELELINQKLYEKLAGKDYVKDVVMDAQFNLLVLLMLEKYNWVFESAFFLQMAEIFLAGHLPCGWRNNHFLVY